jgi:hypothetical protein
MKYPYNMRNFETHVANCSGPTKSAKLPAGGMHTIQSFFQKQNQIPQTAASASTTRKSHLPCLGLSEDVSTKIKAYLDRTGAHGGGASSVTVIASELYGKKFRRLSKARKVQVKVAQKHDWLWRNDVDASRVFSTTCCGNAGGPSSEPQPCAACLSLLKNKQFKNTLQVPTPPDKHYKYVNHEYRNKSLAVLFGRCVDLRSIIEADVSGQTIALVDILTHFDALFPGHSGKATDEICQRRVVW